jgi:NAD-dependent deacetylase
MHTQTSNSNTIKQVSALLKQARHIAVLSGAGMSTESGIPDFRSAGGLWTRDMSLAEAVSIDYFRANPAEFWHTFKSIFSIKLVGNYQANQGHQFLQRLESQGKRVRILTQNIDGLHQRAGSRDVVELHGSLMKAVCPNCQSYYDLQYIREHPVPLCLKCKQVIKPDVVLYGEPVPHIDLAFSCAAEVDCLLVMGSSLEVSPVNFIPRISMDHQIPTVLINLSSTRMDRGFSHVIHAGIGASCEALLQEMNRA